MSIKFKNVSQSKSYRPLKFEDLKIGDIFCSADFGGWCMRTPESCDYEGRIDSNAVDLGSGDLFFHPEGTNVTKLNKDLTIEYTDKDLLEMGRINMFCVKSDNYPDRFYHQKQNAIAKVENIIAGELKDDTPEDYGYTSWREIAEQGGFVGDIAWWFEIKFEDTPQTRETASVSKLVAEMRGE